MDVITNAADSGEEWVRGFLFRLGYHLAGEYHLMPACPLRDLVGNYSADLIDMAEVNTDDLPPPDLHAV